MEQSDVSAVEQQTESVTTKMDKRSLLFDTHVTYIFEFYGYLSGFVWIKRYGYTIY